MEYIQGYPTLLQKCEDNSVIGDILRLADFYNIRRPIPELVSNILNLAINMKNVVEVFEVSRNLDLLVAFKDLATNLSSKCISYLRFNLASWQVLINFMVENKDKTDLVIKIIEFLAQEEVANIRYECLCKFCV